MTKEQTRTAIAFAQSHLTLHVLLAGWARYWRDERTGTDWWRPGWPTRRDWEPDPWTVRAPSPVVDQPGAEIETHARTRLAAELRLKELEGNHEAGSLSDARCEDPSCGCCS